MEYKRTVYACQLAMTYWTIVAFAADAPTRKHMHERRVGINFKGAS